MILKQSLWEKYGLNSLLFIIFNANYSQHGLDQPIHSGPTQVNMLQLFRVGLVFMQNIFAATLSSYIAPVFAIVDVFLLRGRRGELVEGQKK